MKLALVPDSTDHSVLAPIAADAAVVGLDEGPDAVIVVGDPGPVAAETLRHVGDLVRAGTTLVALGVPRGAGWEDLTGVRAGEDIGLGADGEVFATCADPSPLTARAIDEFPVAGSFTTLDPLGPVTTVLTSSIRFAHRPALVERPLGAGRVVTSGFGADALGTHELARIVRRALTGADTVATRSADLGMAVVGYGPYGGMGYLHGTAATETDGLAFVAALDTSAERRKAAEAQFPGVATYAELDHLLRDDDVELVVIATPPSSHADLARACLDAGKHVAVEKPLCITTAEADGLLARSTANERMLTVHQNRRWDADFRALRRAVDAGLLGEVFNVETFVGGFEHPCRAWHSEESVSGGAIYDWGSHHLDWILLLMGGDPVSVTTTRHKRVWHDITNDDQVRVRLAWTDGREAEFFQSDIAGVRRPKFYVQGTEGTIAADYRPFVHETVEHGIGYQRWESHHAEAPVDLTLARYERGYGLTETTLPPLPASPWPFHRNLADHLLLGEPLEVDPVDVRTVIGVLETAQRSGDEGGTTLPLDPAS